MCVYVQSDRFSFSYNLSYLTSKDPERPRNLWGVSGSSDLELPRKTPKPSRTNISWVS